MALGHVTRGISRRWKMKIQITAAVQSPLRRQPVFLWYLLTWIYSWEMEELTNVKILGLKGLRICPWNMINALEVNPALWSLAQIPQTFPVFCASELPWTRKLLFGKYFTVKGIPLALMQWLIGILSAELGCWPFHCTLYFRKWSLANFAMEHS